MGTTEDCEQRLDRPYDQRNLSTFVLPNGSRLVALDQSFVNAVARHVLEAWDKENPHA